jgi:hypothetical protein
METAYCEVLGKDQMKLTPIPYGIFSSSRERTFDLTTWPMTWMKPEGPVIVKRHLSFGQRGWVEQMNAPTMLMFLVSPRIVPSVVIAATGHSSCDLG